MVAGFQGKQGIRSIVFSTPAKKREGAAVASRIVLQQLSERKSKEESWRKAQAKGKSKENGNGNGIGKGGEKSTKEEEVGRQLRRVE